MIVNQLVCNGCLAPIEVGRSFTWFMAKPCHNECAVNQAVVTHAKAAAMVAAVTYDPSMQLPDFLEWMADRMVHVYGESENVDFVLSARHRASLLRAALKDA